ncbi:MAG: SHOCT domain-containing protein [DPANN group archaeon]|nr:SHOCT domain-containing protein [DPANN group archaeon]
MYYIEHMGYLGWFWMILFWGAFIWLIVWLVDKNKDTKKDKTPSQIAKERYAKGELTKKEYQDISKEIRE